MNAHHRPTTMAAEGQQRFRWTLNDIERLVQSGVFKDTDRLELIGGELVPMSPKGNHHEHLRSELTFVLTKLCPEHLRVASEPQFNLAEDEYRQPDLLVYRADIRVHDVRGDTALLVIEVADSSLDHDTGDKAATYAKYGVCEYWVIDAKTRVTQVFRNPGLTGYASQTEKSAKTKLVARKVPQLTVTLAKLR